MRFSLKQFFLLVVILLSIIAISLNALLGRIARSEEFKQFAEKKLSEYLKAKVNIGEIRPYCFNQIALEKIIIEAPSVKSGSQLIRLERLIFRYDLKQLWSRRLDVPTGIVLKNPSVLIEQDRLPYFYFAKETNSPSVFSVPTLDFQGGEIRYLLPGTGKEILLTEVEGKILPSLGQEVRVDIRAKAEGVLTGRVHIYGVILAAKHSHDLWLELKGMNFSKDIPLPLKDIEGKVHWVGQDLFFDSLRSMLHGWQTELSGSLTHLKGFPEVTWHIQAGKGMPRCKLDFAMSLSEQKLQGVFQPFKDKVFPFVGRVHQDGKRFLIDSLLVNHTWKGGGELDFASGNYQFSFTDGRQRFAFHSNLQKLDFIVYFNLEHWKLSGLDIVTRGKMFLHAMSTRWHDRNFMFKGSFETDYFILERQPFEDLKGAFEVSPYGVTGIRASWGKQFQLTGQVLFHEKEPVGKFQLQVKNFNLGLVQEFASKPLPKEIGGLLDGKLLIQGELGQLEAIGAFNIRDGKWGRLHYDHGIVQFRGVPPYLPLQESKIWKGRTTFFLKGALDLRLDNVFAGVKIETPDHLVIWKGIEAAMHEKDRTIEVSRSGLGGSGRFSLLEAETKETPIGGTPGASNDGREEEKAVLVGPKFKF